VRHLSGRERLIVALDVPTHEAALRLVDRLDNVSTFKIGLELLMAGDVAGLIRRLRRERGEGCGVFVDLKIGGDIPNTVGAFIRSCMEAGVRFVTLVEAVPASLTTTSVAVARQVRGDAPEPKLLIVPLLSSQNATDIGDAGADLGLYIASRARRMLEAGCDGLIVSGEAIGTCRTVLGPETVIVSPGIRPTWWGSNDHKRPMTPAEAIRLGADYLVVGRPICLSSNPKTAAQRVIDEVDGVIST